MVLSPCRKLEILRASRVLGHRTCTRYWRSPRRLRRCAPPDTVALNCRRPRRPAGCGLRTTRPFGSSTTGGLAPPRSAFAGVSAELRRRRGLLPIDARPMEEADKEHEACRAHGDLRRVVPPPAAAVAQADEPDILGESGPILGVSSVLKPRLDKRGCIAARHAEIVQPPERVARRDPSDVLLEGPHLGALADAVPAGPHLGICARSAGVKTEIGPQARGAAAGRWGTRGVLERRWIRGRTGPRPLACRLGSEGRPASTPGGVRRTRRARRD